MPRPLNPETQRKIIQLISHDDDLFCLTECGNVFVLNDGDRNNPPEWEHVIESPYLEE